MAGCSNKENAYMKNIVPIIENFNSEIQQLTAVYNSLENDPDIVNNIVEIQTGLYEIKLELLSLNTPDAEEFLLFQNDFLRTIEEFELLTYKLNGLATLYNSKDDYNVSGSNYSMQSKKIKNKKSVVENLISIQEEDMRRTVLSCRDLLTNLKKSSQFLDNARFVFPEFIIR